MAFCLAMRNLFALPWIQPKKERKRRLGTKWCFFQTILFPGLFLPYYPFLFSSYEKNQEIQSRLSTPWYCNFKHIHIPCAGYFERNHVWCQDQHEQTSHQPEHQDHLEDEAGWPKKSLTSVDFESIILYII